MSVFPYCLLNMSCHCIFSNPLVQYPVVCLIFLVDILLRCCIFLAILLFVFLYLWHREHYRHEKLLYFLIYSCLYHKHILNLYIPLLKDKHNKIMILNVCLHNSLKKSLFYYHFHYHFYNIIFFIIH